MPETRDERIKRLEVDLLGRFLNAAGHRLPTLTYNRGITHTSPACYRFTDPYSIGLAGRRVRTPKLSSCRTWSISSP